MNSKTIWILRNLADGKFHKVAELADALKISPRLARYEIGETNAFLEREGFPVFQYKSASGLKLELSKEQQEELKKKLSSLDTYDYVMTSKERRDVMLLMMLASGGKPLTSQYFAGQMGMSKSSIDKDMALLKTDLLGSGIRLESRVGKGSTLEGNEQDLRSFGVRMLEQCVDFAGLYQSASGSMDMVERWARELFCDGVVQPLVPIVRKLERGSLGKWLAYDSFRMITLMLAVTLKRVQAGKTSEVSSANMSLVKTTREYIYAVQLAEALEEQFQVELPAGEVYALAILLAGARYVTPEPYLKDDWVEVQLLMDRLVHGMSEEMEIDFAEDEEIYNALQSHLGPTVFRLRHGIPITNPNLSEIKKEYPECFEALQQVLESLHSSLLAGITEDDLAYLVLHFCASIERRRRLMPVSRVMIVCMHGAGTANLLRELVCSRFKNIQVIATATYSDLQELEKMEADFIITSIPLPGCRIPWVKVSTIPDTEDWDNISKMILKYSTRNQIRSDDMLFFKNIVAVVQEQCDIHDMDEFMTSLAACFEANGLAVRTDRIQPTLPQLLEPCKIRIRQQAKDWEDAVKSACSVLTEAGDVTDEFTRSAIQSVQKAGPYIVIMPGVALVHGEVGKGVKRLSMSMVTLENEVYFHHPSNDPVRLVLCLAPVDNWSHIQALRGILNLLNRIPVQTICEADSPLELYQYVKESCE